MNAPAIGGFTKTHTEERGCTHSQYNPGEDWSTEDGHWVSGFSNQVSVVLAWGEQCFLAEGAAPAQGDVRQVFVATAKEEGGDALVISSSGVEPRELLNNTQDSPCDKDLFHLKWH